MLKQVQPVLGNISSPMRTVQASMPHGVGSKYLLHAVLSKFLHSECGTDVLSLHVQSAKFGRGLRVGIRKRSDPYEFTVEEVP